MAVRRYCERCAQLTRRYYERPVAALICQYCLRHVGSRCGQDGASPCIWTRKPFPVCPDCWMHHLQDLLRCVTKTEPQVLQIFRFQLRLQLQRATLAKRLRFWHEERFPMGPHSDPGGRNLPSQQNSGKWLSAHDFEDVQRSYLRWAADHDVFEEYQRRLARVKPRRIIRVSSLTGIADRAESYYLSRRYIKVRNKIIFMSDDSDGEGIYWFSATDRQRYIFEQHLSRRTAIRDGYQAQVDP